MEKLQIPKQAKDISQSVEDLKIKKLILNILENEKKQQRMLRELLDIPKKEARK